MIIYSVSEKEQFVFIFNLQYGTNYNYFVYSYVRNDAYYLFTIKLNRTRLLTTCLYSFLQVGNP